MLVSTKIAMKGTTMEPEDIPDIPDIAPGDQTPGGPPPPEWRTK